MEGRLQHSPPYKASDIMRLMRNCCRLRELQGILRVVKSHGQDIQRIDRLKSQGQALLCCMLPEPQAGLAKALLNLH